MAHLVTAPSGGKLSVECWGPRDGTPVFLMHGTPGSRNGPRPRGIVLHRLGIRLISYDRPGYGDSARQQGRAVFHAADDVAAIADSEGLQKFAVVGRSGGGPHAMACAARMPERVAKVAVLVTLAPADAEDLDWYDGMTKLNVSEYSRVDQDRTGGLTTLIEQTRAIQQDPETLLKSLRPELSETDLRIVDDIAIRRLLIQTYEEGLKNSADGWLDDVLAFRRPWGFKPADITVPMLLWHGADDRFSPADHTRWLARQVPQAESWVESDAAHFSAVEVLPSILAWASAPPATSFAASRADARS